MVYLCKMPPVYGFQYRTFKIIRFLVLGMLLANQDTELTQHTGSQRFFNVCGSLTYIPGGGLLTGFAMRSDPKGFSGFGGCFVWFFYFWQPVVASSDSRIALKLTNPSVSQNLPKRKNAKE